MLYPSITGGSTFESTAPLLRVMTIGQARDYLSLRDKNYRDFAIFNTTRSIEFEPYVLNVDDQKSLWYCDKKKCNPPLIFTFDDLLDFSITEKTEILKEVQEQNNYFLDWLIGPTKRVEKPISGILVSEISLNLKVRNSPLETLLKKSSFPFECYLFNRETKTRNVWLISNFLVI